MMYMELEMFEKASILTTLHYTNYTKQHNTTQHFTTPHHTTPHDGLIAGTPRERSTRERERDYICDAPSHGTGDR